MIRLEPLPQHDVIDPRGRDFANWFGWSFNTQKILNGCERRWWLRYVLFWRGWEYDEDREARLAYRLSKMETVATVAGRVVHEAAAWRHAAPNVANFDQAERMLRDRIRRAIVAAKAEEWRRDPKASPPLSEYYYSGGGVQPPAESGPRILENALRCLVQVFTAPLEDLCLVTEPEADSLLVDHFGVPVWCQFDLVYLEGDTVVARDWKTGRPRPEHAAQAAIQAVIARRVWRRPVAVEMEYLNRGTRERADQDDEMLGQVEQMIVDSADGLRERFDDPRLAGGDPAKFPPTNNPEICRGCDLLHVCQGTRCRDEADPDRASIPARFNRSPVTSGRFTTLEEDQP